MDLLIFSKNETLLAIRIFLFNKQIALKLNLINKFKNFNKQFQNLIFIKSVKKNQINEIDFPIIGNKTLELLIKFNFKAVCLLNKNILIANKVLFLEKINKSKLSLIVI